VTVNIEKKTCTITREKVLEENSGYVLATLLYKECVYS